MITVSTKYLKHQLLQYTDNITVIPNTLMNLWKFNSDKKAKNLKSKNQIKIGYFGTRSHGNDLLLLETAISNIKKQLKKEITLEIVGVSHETQDWIIKINIPNNYKDNPTAKDKIKNILQNILNKFNLMPPYLPYCSFIKWMKNEIGWDFAVAPLEDTNINKSKSNLKYLEYTALNIPGVYSDIGPYKELGEKNTGIVVNNTTEEWETALIGLIEDNELYETLLENAREDVKKNYLVKRSAEIWKNILKK